MVLQECSSPLQSIAPLSMITLSSFLRTSIFIFIFQSNTTFVFIAKLLIQKDPMLLSLIAPHIAPTHHFNESGVPEDGDHKVKKLLCVAF